MAARTSCARTYAWMPWLGGVPDELADDRPRVVLGALERVRGATPRLQWVTERMRTIVADVSRERAWLGPASGSEATLDLGVGHLDRLVEDALRIRDAAAAVSRARDDEAAARERLVVTLRALEGAARRVRSVAGDHGWLIVRYDVLRAEGRRRNAADRQGRDRPASGPAATEPGPEA